MADKTYLIRYFQQHPQIWYKLSAIKAHVGDVPDRTLRRWLAALVKQGLLERSGEKKGTRYRWVELLEQNNISQGVAEATVMRPTAPAFLFSDTSNKLLANVRAPLYTRLPVTYAEAWLDSYIPNQSFYLSNLDRALLHRQGKRQAIQGNGVTYIQKIFNRMLIDVSYNSARLEGNTYSLADTEQLLLRGLSAAGKLDEERIMILNHKEAIRYLAQRVGNLVIDEETVRTLHYLLAYNLVAPNMAGHIRDEGIGIGGTTYAPLEGRQRLTRLLNKVLDKARAIDDSFEQSFFLLGHIAYLQAFIDVNKRTSRLMSIVPLITADYVPQSFIDVDKDDYLQAMIAFYEFNQTQPLAELYVWSYQRCCAHYDVAAEVVTFDEIAARYRVQRREIVRAIVLKHVPPDDVQRYVEVNMPAEVAHAHHAKFVQDVLDELQYLDESRMAGLGITREELLAWQRANSN